MKKLKKIIITLFIIIILAAGSMVGLYLYNTGAVSSSSEVVEFKVEHGTTPNEIIPKLKEAGLIKSEFFTKVYIKLNGISSIHAGKYELNKNMDLNDLFKTIGNSENQKNNTSTITFKEGKTIENYISLITENTNIKEGEIYKLLNDREYIKTLINKYWFLTDDILNDDIYYSLEGYLAPDTYEFLKEDVTAEDIITTLLDQEEKVLNKYKDKISSTGFNIHEVITLASIAESEGNNLDDRKKIIGVFVNRLNNNIPLGSDVTAYYGARVDMADRDLYYDEIIDENPYNTRVSSSAGRLPVGPICNPSEEAIEAVVNYIKNDYFYFVSDKNGKLYFCETEDEHTSLIDELKEKGLWFEYE